MSRYIDADVLIEKIIKKATEMFTVDSVYQHYLNALIDVEDIIKAEPTADVVERKRGEWILTEDDNYEYCTCSECGYQNGENWMNGSDIPFCAECGADMRGEKER